MYAVIQTGGKQYRVSEGDTSKLRSWRPKKARASIFDQVLMVADGDDVKVGKPYLVGGKVTATVESHGRAQEG